MTDIITEVQGDELRFGRSVITGFIVIPEDGEPFFPHGDGFRIYLAGDETRVVGADGRVLWHVLGLDVHFARRLEELRTELRAERISLGELAELQALADHIPPGDVELLEAAGVPEHSDAEKVTVTVRQLRDVLTEAMQRPADGETPVAELPVSLAIFDPARENTKLGTVEPDETFNYDGEAFILHARLDE